MIKYKVSYKYKINDYLYNKDVNELTFLHLCIMYNNLTYLY